ASCPPRPARRAPLARGRAPSGADPGPRTGCRRPLERCLRGAPDGSWARGSWYPKAAGLLAWRERPEVRGRARRQIGIAREVGHEPRAPPEEIGGRRVQLGVSCDAALQALANGLERVEAMAPVARPARLGLEAVEEGHGHEVLADRLAPRRHVRHRERPERRERRERRLAGHTNELEIAPERQER